MLLPDQFAKASRAPFACQNLIRHAYSGSDHPTAKARYADPHAGAHAPRLSAASLPRYPSALDGQPAAAPAGCSGEVSERSKEHAWKVCIRSKAVSRVRIPPSPPVPSAALAHEVHGGPVGPSATIVCKPRQARKGATVVNDSGAGMWLAGLPPLIDTREKAARSTRQLQAGSTSTPCPWDPLWTSPVATHPRSKRAGQKSPKVAAGRRADHDPSLNRIADMRSDGG